MLEILFHLEMHLWKLKYCKQQIHVDFFLEVKSK